MKNTYRMLGVAIREARIKARKTQSELADCVGLTRTSVANIEAGRQRILLHQIEDFAWSLRLTPRKLANKIWFV